VQNPKLPSMSVNRNCHTPSYKHADKIIVDEISSINIAPEIIPATMELGKFKRMLRIGLRKCQPKLSQSPHPSRTIYYLTSVKNSQNGHIYNIYNIYNYGFQDI